MPESLMPRSALDTWAPMNNRYQDSCGDCGWHHGVLKCYRRNSRKMELRKAIYAATEELRMLENYEAHNA